MRIAILGTGHAGTTLATGLVAVGHDVVFGSRTPESKTGLPAPVLSTAEAIGGADLVLSALQASVAVEALTGLKQELAGHVLLDIGNAVSPQLELLYPNASLGAALQAALPETRVVKSLNTLAVTTTIAPGTLDAPTNVFLSGDDEAAKAVVSAVLADLGWPAERQLDLGGIDTARGVEHYFLLFVSLMQRLQGGAFNVAVVR